MVIPRITLNYHLSHPVLACPHNFNIHQGRFYARSYSVLGVGDLPPALLRKT